MAEMEHVLLSRDCNAIRIPAGDRINLPAGTECLITQSLGGSFTVQVRSHGGLFRIAGSDAEALGKDVPEESKLAETAGADLEQRIDQALRSCYDPEIPVNIVDLGLIYDTRMTQRGDGSHSVAIKMTLTAQGCGMGAAIAADAEDKIRAIDGISETSVEIVWDPPWNPRMISDQGRQKLGI